MRVITFNVNSIAKRLSALLDFIDEHSVDVALLQELKATEERFPRAEIEAAGWQVALVPEKGFNGVAVLSRDPNMRVRRSELPHFSTDGDKDQQARYLEVATHGIVVASIYAPNGNPVYNADDNTGDDTDDKTSDNTDDKTSDNTDDKIGDEFENRSATSKKFRYKLAWMERICSHIENQLLVEGCHFLLGGDFNVCPQASDVFDEQAMAGDALLRTESRRLYRRMLCSGLVDAWRALPLIKKAQSHRSSKARGNGYTYWDYRGGRFQRDEGLRIDMFFLSPYLSERLEDCFVASSLRALDNPSDHAPLCLDLACDDRVSSKVPIASVATKTKEQDVKALDPSKSQPENSAQKTLEM